MNRIAAVLVALLVFGAAKLPLEQSLHNAHRAAYFHSATLNLTLREQIGQGAFLAALSGFRGVIADFLSLQAAAAWENTQWSRVIFLYNQITTLQPRSTLNWEMGAWYMAFDAAQAALDDPKQPRQTLREKARRAFIQQGREFLERGIRNNPDRSVLYNRLGFLLMEKTNDHLGASQAYAKAAEFPDCMGYEKRFALYELCRVPGRESEAYKLLLKLYWSGPSERTPMLLSRIQALEEKLHIPPEQRVYKPAAKTQ
ncbi:MAG: hypothetical protein NTZ46_01660 [Verrucomicrobia bacterium]|nr:hypothetical protein [Verrucomicrobiota bacterium]